MSQISPAQNLPKTYDEETPNVLSVSDLNQAIKNQLEGSFPLLWVQGEISNFKAHTSGHFYFSLKDRQAQISAVMFRGHNSRLRFRPEDGMEIMARARVTVYPPRGQYQLVCDLLEPVGAGALQKAYEQLRNKLAAEGLFADERKRPIPLHPRHVAVVTSPTGAAVRDILNVLRRRVRGLRVTVIPAMVQGEQAPASLLRALSQLEKLQDVDVAIIGRGGGSIEDLWCFNDEAVVRGIAHLKVPVISAVGHEVDFTLSDFVADLRAPTPSAAAELVAKSALEIEDRLRQQQRLLVQTIQSALRWHGEKLHSVQKRLVDPRRRIIEHIQRCDELLWRLKQALLRGLRLDQNRWQALKKRLPTPLLVIKKQEQTLRDLNHRLRGSSKQILAQRRWQLQKSMSLLDSLSPLRVVDRGFALVSKGPQLVMEARQLVRGDCVQLRLRDGQVEAQVTEIYIGKMDHMDHIEPES